MYQAALLLLNIVASHSCTYELYIGTGAVSVIIIKIPARAKVMIIALLFVNLRNHPHICVF